MIFIFKFSLFILFQHYCLFELSVYAVFFTIPANSTIIYQELIVLNPKYINSSFFKEMYQQKIQLKHYKHVEIE